jgi:MFS family permease
MSTGNATLQLGADPSMRGRVMSLWFVAFQGSTPIGGPIVGAVMSAFGPRAGLGLGAVTCFVVALAGAVFLRLHRPPAIGVSSAPSGLFPRPARLKS